MNTEQLLILVARAEVDELKQKLSQLSTKQQKRAKYGLA
jgi:hypothetical protein